MALNAKKALAASKSYTDEVVAGGGTIKGKNCTIDSIVPVAPTQSTPGGQRVTFKWTLDTGVEQTSIMDVFNGVDGQGIDRMYVDNDSHLIVVYDDGTEEDVGEITIPDFQADWNETDPEENSFIKNKPLLGTASGMDVPEEGHDAGDGQVVLGNDSRLTNDRNAADVYNWAKAENPPTYTKSDVGLGNVDNTSDANKPVSIAQQTALDAKTDLTNISDVEATTTASKAYTTGDYLIYSGVLYKVTSDIALDGFIVISGASANVTAVKVTDEMGHGGSGGATDYSDLTNKPSINNVTLVGNKTASDLGLATPSDIVQSDWNEVDTGSKAYIDNKPTLGTAAAKDSTNSVTQSSTDLIESGAVYTALQGKVNTTDVGAASGVAGLDANGKVPSSQLPSYVDDVVEGYYDSETDRFYEESTFETVITPVEGKSWVDVATNKSYRWTGSVYVRVDEGVQLGETSSTAYRGDRGKTAYDFSQSHPNVVGDVGVSGHVSIYNGDVTGRTYTSGEAAASAHTHDSRYLSSSAQTDINNAVKITNVNQTISGNKAFENDVTVGTSSTPVSVMGIASDVSNIKEVIPSTATSSNKLATMEDIPSVPVVTGKADKVDNATDGNFAGLDANGNLTDSGKKASDFTGKSFDGTSQEWAALSAAQKAEYADGLVLIKNDTANAMLVDSTPTEGSNNLVKSGGVYAHRVVAGKQADTTLGLCATAEGLNNQASGDYCHVEGRLNLASGQASHAEGYTSIARGDYSHAGGYWSLAQKKGQTVIGRLNEYEEYTESTDYGVYAFIIGNGTSNNARHNAFAVKWDGTHEMNGDVIIGQHYDSAQSQNVGSNLTVSGIITVNGSDYAEKFESIEDCPVGRFVTLDGERIRLAQPGDDYILGVTSENPAIVGDKNNPGTPVGLVGKLWVEHDGTAEVNGYVCCGKDGIATMELHRQCVYRVMAVDGNRCKILVK